MSGENPYIPHTTYYILPVPMKHIGIVGITAEGSALCYQTICREAAKKFPDLRHPEISIHNRSFHEFR